MPSGFVTRKNKNKNKTEKKNDSQIVVSQINSLSLLFTLQIIMKTSSGVISCRPSYLNLLLSVLD